MSSWLPWKRGLDRRTGPADVMRVSNLELACSIRRLELTRARCEARIQKLEAEVAELERPANVAHVLRRKQTRRLLRISQNRLGAICEQIASVEARRGRNEDLGTLMELQASTANAIRGLQDTAPELFSGNVDAMTREDQKLQQYEDGMRVALEMMKGSEEEDADIDAQIEADEQRFMQAHVFEMSSVWVPESTIRSAPAAAHTTAPVAAAAASSKPSDDGSDQKHN